MEIDELIASYDPIDFKFAEIDKQASKSFIPSEKECDDIFGINALRGLKPIRFGSSGHSHLSAVTDF